MIIKSIKEILGRIWAVWGLFFFIFTMLLFMIPFMIIRRKAEPVRTRRFIRTSKMWMDIFLTGIGCPLTVKGKAHFATDKNYIVVCNHNSLMDVPVSCPYVPGGNKTIAKKEFARTPLFGIMYKMGSVLVDRNNEKSRRDSYQQMKYVLNIGLHMCIYPEGTRNKTAEPLKPFHDGAFRLALETRKEIIPSLLFYTRTAMPSDKTFFLWPHHLEMHFLPPITIQESDTVTGLKEKVFMLMRDYYISNRHQ